MDLQDKEVTDKIKYGALSYKPVNKTDLQTTMTTVNKINQYHRTLTNSLKKQVEIIRTGMLNITSLEQWPEDMDYDITLVLLLLEKTMKDLR